MAIKMNKKKAVVKKVIKKPVIKAKKTAMVAQEVPQLQPPVGEYVEGIGRRKSAVARVRIYPKIKGDYAVNGLPVGQYFRGIINAQAKYLLPLELTGWVNKFAIYAKVSGSGSSGQLGAVIHGLSRALVNWNVELKPLLKAESLLTRDSRMKETRKIGTGGKARRQRQSPKR